MKIYAWFLSLALFSTSIFTADSVETSEVRDFRLLFDTILKSPIPYGLSVDEKYVEIAAEIDILRQIKHELDKALSSQASFFANLPYRLENLEPSSSNLSLNTDEIPDFNARSVEEAVAVITNLVGEEAFEDLSVDLNKLYNNKSGAIFENGVLYSKPIAKITINTYREIFKVIMAYFLNISIDDIKKAYLTPDIHLTMPTNVPKDDEINGVSGLLQKCFGIMEAKEGTRAFIDLSRLYQLIFPPKITLETSVLRIQRDHLMTYLQQVNGDRVLLRVFDKSGEKYAHPIVLSEGSHVDKAHYNYIIIDRSASLNDYYHDLTNHIKSFIIRLDKTNPANKIKLVFFSQTMDPVFAYDLCNSSAIECAIDSTRENLGSSTRLFLTIRDVFQEIRKEELISKFNVSVTVFTDGEDNVGGTFRDIQTEIDSFEQISRPKVFTLGFGNAAVKTLTDLANTMGGPYIPLKSIADFDQIQEHLLEFNNERELIEFAFRLLNQQHVITIPVPKDNAPHPLNIVLPMSGERLPVSVSGKNMVALIGPKEKVAHANITDEIWLLSAKASGIAIDSNLQAKEKISLLHSILGELEKLSNNNNAKKHDILLINITLDRINKDINEFIGVFQGQKSADIAKANVSYRNGLFTPNK